jgi:nitronate monooxygenase
MAPIDLKAALSLTHPILLAPLGGGPSTPELVAAVSSAGGFGWLAAPYLAPDAIREAVRKLRALTSRPFGVNLFAGGWSRERPAEAPEPLSFIARYHARLGLPPPALPDVPPDPFPAQLEVVLDARPAAFSFTFGIPPPEAMEALRSRGILTFGTATCVREAQLLAEAGVDGVLAQGAEAGGHRGTFAAALEEGLIPARQLVAEIRRAVPLPVVATGGIMDGRDIRAALDAGAAAAQLGTAFLACPESGASAAYKQALLSAGADTTVLTRAFSGRWARGLKNEFTDAAAQRPEVILPYPAQNQLTRAMRQAANQKGEPAMLSLWAGQGVARIRALHAGDLVRALADELQAA